MLIVASRQEPLFDSVSVALVGKYTDLKDSYMSVTKALEHPAFRVHRKLIIHIRPILLVSALHFFLLTYVQWVESSDLEPETASWSSGLEQPRR
jgi:CTP synthase